MMRITKFLSFCTIWLGFLAGAWAQTNASTTAAPRRRFREASRQFTPEIIHCSTSQLVTSIR